MTEAIKVGARVCIGVLTAAIGVQPGQLRAQTAAPVTSASIPPVTPPARRSGAPALEEVVVTAQRRNERLQKVPITITALPATQLKAAGITDTHELAQVTPSLTIASNGPSQTTFIRGVGADTGNLNQEPSVATYIDDVYIASPTGGQFALNNIAQVTVLKGPQGTLFGRNATGGVIQIATRDPTQTRRLDAELGYANYNTTSGSLYIGGGIAENIVADLAINGSTQQDGWGHNVLTGAPNFRRNDIDLRSKIIWHPTEQTKIRLELDYDQLYLGEYPFLGLPGHFNADGKPAYVGFYNSENDTPSNNRRLTGGVSLRIDHDFGFVRLASITAYRSISDVYSADEDKGGSPLPAPLPPFPIVDATLFEVGHNVSQEVQLLSEPNSKLNWVIGGFYYNFQAKYNPAQIRGLGGGIVPPDFSFEPFINIFSDTVTNSGSVYGQATYEILPDTHLTGGLRYTIERQTNQGTIIDPPAGNIVLVPPTSTDQGFDKLTWRGALDHQFTPDLLAYVSYNRGIKSGGFDLFNPAAPGYRPEQLDAYEVGIKDELFAHRLRLNVSGFYYDYKNIQEEAAVTGGTITVNAGQAHLYGVDVDMQAAVTDNFKLFGGASYLHSTYYKFPDESQNPPNPGPASTGNDVRGNTTPEAPTFTGDIGGAYTVPTPHGDFVGSAIYSYNNGFYWDSSNRLSQPSYFLLNAALNWTSPSGRYGAAVFGRNLTGAHYYNQQISTAGLGDLALPAAPRTYGFTVSVHY